MATAPPGEKQGAAQPGAKHGHTYRALHWKISPRETVLNAYRYSKFVRFMKGALPLAAFALAVAVIGYALQPRDTGRITMTFERLGRLEGDLTMVKPQLTGTDDEGRPFVVTAASAVQMGPGSDTVRLEDVTADISLSDGTSLHITAATGVVDTRTHVLDATDVHITSKNSYDARTAAAKANLKTGIVKGDSPVEADGKFGHITARGFALSRNTRQLQFSGDVRMVLNESRPPPSAPVPTLRKTAE